MQIVYAELDSDSEEDEEEEDDDDSGETIFSLGVLTVVRGSPILRIWCAIPSLLRAFYRVALCVLRLEMWRFFFLAQP